MDFEFDANKSRTNRQKHGIDCVRAQRLWADDNRLEISARSLDEPRSMLIARHRGKHWSALYTMRNERIRIISVRRSRKEERELYESHRSGQDV